MIRVFYPESIYKLLEALSKHKVYVVGGFVRDMLLRGRGGEFSFRHVIIPEGRASGLSGISDKSVKDIDLVTADPLEAFLPTVQGLSEHYHVTNHYEAIQFSFDSYQVTLTRLRYDAVCDGRQAEVVFVKTLQEDMWRRDFTINALYADAEGEAIDFLGGYQDLAQKKVRFIGDPELRIKEDVLRILRYVRFCSLLGADMDLQLLDVMRLYLPRLESISHDRVQQEIKKTKRLTRGAENLQKLFSNQNLLPNA